MFAKAAQRLGFAIAEVAEIQAFRERGERPCAYVLGVLDRQVDDLGQFIGDLEALRTELIAPEARADRLPKDHTRYCSVIGHATPSE